MAMNVYKIRAVVRRINGGRVYEYRMGDIWRVINVQNNGQEKKCVH